ncbi:MAG TPA: hypothetical protein VJ857_03645, partial [Methanocorpusculum sp.]|nr:hypothetical protein [Methanocorpusculum sp.]
GFLKSMDIVPKSINQAISLPFSKDTFKPKGGQLSLVILEPPGCGARFPVLSYYLKRSVVYGS